MIRITFKIKAWIRVYFDGEIDRNRDRTRGHEVTLVKDQCRLDIRMYSFSQRAINEWNKLATDCLTGSSVNITNQRWPQCADVFRRLGKKCVVLSEIRRLFGLCLGKGCSAGRWRMR